MVSVALPGTAAVASRLGDVGDVDPGLCEAF